MYINLLQNRVSRSVKTVTTILLQKFVSCINLQLPNNNFGKNLLSQTLGVKRNVHVYQYSSKLG